MSSFTYLVSNTSYQRTGLVMPETNAMENTCNVHICSMFNVKYKCVSYETKTCRLKVVNCNIFLMNL